MALWPSALVRAFLWKEPQKVAAFSVLHLLVPCLEQVLWEPMTEGLWMGRYSVEARDARRGWVMSAWLMAASRETKSEAEWGLRRASEWAEG